MLSEKCKFKGNYTYGDAHWGDLLTAYKGQTITYDGIGNPPNDGTWTYTWENGRQIKTLTEGGETITYTYDAQGQLTKAAGNTTYNYSYDTVGNIISGNGHTYTYGNSDWKDLLTKVDGQTIDYDDSGNPTSYYNGTSWSFGWSNGRQLTSASGDGKTISYTYDANGLRTSKTVDGVTHNYLYAGGKLLRETFGSITMDFFYDASGNPYALKHNGTVYYYITNLQGDVMKLVNASGTAVATYDYDPYGNVITATGTLAEINPLRYRGYYYDTESQMYYCQSRYYDPEIGRFINADSLASTGQGILGNNMFAYCRNSPVFKIDVPGTYDVECGDENPLNKEDLQNDYGPGGANNSTSAATKPSYGGRHLGNTGSTSDICFAAGILVQTADGSIPIEDVEIGDVVWAWDEETGDVALREVVETYVNETDEFVHVFVNGEEIVATPSHPFFSPAKGWMKAVCLRSGDILVLLNGDYVVVEKVEHEILETPVTVYNFQVEGYHTYYVTDTGVLVHNSCSTNPRHTPDQQALVELAKEIEMNARQGNFISYQDALLLDEWATEYGVNQRHGALIESGQHWRTGWDHTHIYNLHVPFLVETK